MLTLYGIKNCDSVKKARLWLDENNVDYQFHDFRVDGLTAQQMQSFIAKTGLEKLLNKRSTSWRQLDEQQQADLNAEKAAVLMLDNPTLIKRPVLQLDEQLIIGFNAKIYQTIL